MQIYYVYFSQHFSTMMMLQNTKLSLKICLCLQVAGQKTAQTNGRRISANFAPCADDMGNKISVRKLEYIG